MKKKSINEMSIQKQNHLNIKIKRKLIKSIYQNSSNGTELRTQNSELRILFNITIKIYTQI